MSITSRLCEVWMMALILKMGEVVLWKPERKPDTPVDTWSISKDLGNACFWEIYFCGDQ